ncbi:MAG: epoxyqueuosine reductase [Anaerolineae bacterium]
MGDLALELTDALVDAGAALVGFADMRQVPSELRQGLPRAVSIVVARAPSIVAALRHGPTRETVDEMQRHSDLLSELRAVAVRVLEEHGHQAVTRPTRQYGVDGATLATALPHKTAATRAGLGWIGRCAVLVTEAYGSAVRLTTVLTDAPLPVAVPTDESACGECHACVDVCPGHAVTGQAWRVGMPREALLDAFACRDTGWALSEARELSYNQCGYCVAFCSRTESYLRLRGALGRQ